MEKPFNEDAYALGMLYVYLYSNKKQILVSKDALEKFEKCIENNIGEIDVDNIKVPNYEFEPIYFDGRNENGKEYYILKPDFNLSLAQYMYIESVSNKYIEASLMPNSLDCLGLVKINDKIILKRDCIKQKQEGECCSNCEYNISSELIDQIIKENSEYQKISEKEAYEKIGFCEFEIDKETVKNMDYWCPNYSRLEVEPEIQKVKKIKN